MAPQVGIREALGAITFPEFILEQGEGCGRMLNLAIRIWVCFLDAPELVPKIPVNATPRYHQERQRKGPGHVRGGLGRTARAPEKARLLVCPSPAGAPWCQGHYQNQAPDGHLGPG